MCASRMVFFTWLIIGFVHLTISVSAVVLNATEDPPFAYYYDELFGVTPINNQPTIFNWTTIVDRHCPYYASCSSNISLASPPVQGLVTGACCQPCDCSSSCRTSNCCPGVQSHAAGTVQCQDQFELFNEPRGFQELDHGHFYVIDTCEKSFKDDDIADACLQPKGLQGFTLVIDTDNHRVYKNDKCAQCNNITEFVYWDLVAAVNLTWLNLDLDNFTERVLSGTAVYSRPPTSIDQYSVDMNRCVPGSIDTCNQTGLWDMYDAELEAACIRSPYTLYYGWFYFFNTAYSNVYCYLCNQRSSSVLSKHPNSCPPVGEFIVTDSIYRDDLKAVLNMTHVSRLLIDVNRTDICDVDEVFDNAMMKCRVLECPIDNIAAFGECDSRVLQTEGLAVKFTIKLRRTSPRKYSSTVGRSYYRNVFDTVVKEFGLDFKGSNCAIFDQLFYVHNNKSSPVYLELTVLTGSNCKSSDITVVLAGAKGTTYKAKLVFDVSRENRTHRFYRRSAGPLYTSSNTRHLQSRFYCPSIQITQADLDEIDRMHGASVSDKIRQVSDMTSGRQINSIASTTFGRVCIDEYLKAFEVSTEDGKAMPSHGVRNEAGIVLIGVATVMLNW